MSTETDKLSDGQASRAGRGEAAFEAGLATRRKVMGDKYVDAALDGASDFSWPMQKLVTEYCWNEVWNRPGLSHRDRSLLNLAMISVLNRPHELRGHVRGALTNGLSVEEIQEALLQVSIYGGVPAALDSFRIAQSAIEDFMGEKSA